MIRPPEPASPAASWSAYACHVCERRSRAPGCTDAKPGSIRQTIYRVPIHSMASRVGSNNVAERARWIQVLVPTERRSLGRSPPPHRHRMPSCSAFLHFSSASTSQDQAAARDWLPQLHRGPRCLCPHVTCCSTQAFPVMPPPPQCRSRASDWTATLAKRCTRPCGPASRLPPPSMHVFFEAGTCPHRPAGRLPGPWGVHGKSRRCACEYSASYSSSSPSPSRLCLLRCVCGILWLACFIHLPVVFAVRAGPTLTPWSCVSSSSSSSHLFEHILLPTRYHWLASYLPCEPRSPKNRFVKR